MKNYPVTRISIISIISFIGIILMQTYWIYDSYRERKAHFQEHIYRILDRAEESFCNEIHNTNPANQQVLMDSIIRKGMNHLEKIPEYSCRIQSAELAVDKPGNGDMIFEQKLRCEQLGDKKIVLLIHNKGSFFFQSLIIWIIVSSILILTAFILTGLNLQIIRKQKKVSKIKSDFISNMTHELKTPIATISVASEMLMKDRVLQNTEKSKRYSKIIFEENQRLKKLVERVMQIALFENGTMKIKLKDENLHEIIEKSCTAIEMIVLDRKGKLDLKLSAGNPVYKVDASHFANIISNLLENAIKYSPESPEIMVETNDYADGISIRISDKGVGIAKKYQERIFDRFFRVQHGDIHSTKGFGLGLYYVKRVVELHGGTINVESKEGVGTTFEIYIPRI